MAWKKRGLYFFILFFLVAVLNFIARKKMAYTYADLPGYNQLYIPKEQLRITQISATKDQSVFIAFTGNGIKQNNTFHVYHNDTLLTTVHAKDLVFKPLVGGRKYDIKINDIAGNASVSLDYAPDSVYRQAGNSSQQNFEFTASNIPVEPGLLYSVNDWAIRFDELSNDSDKKEVDAYINDSMHITPADGSMDRVLKIAHFILQRVKGMDGTPTDSMMQLSPVKQLKCAQAGKSRLWCGIYTAIFSYFAVRAGVLVRLVSCGNDRAGISSGAHTFNEVYLKEYNSWVYVDLLAKTIFVKKGDQYLNAIDIYRLVRYSIDDPDLIAYYDNGDSVVQKPFNQVASTAQYYFHPHNTFTFFFSDYLTIQNSGNLFERGKKIFYTKPYYALYGDDIGIGKSQFIFRIITTYLMFLFLGLWLIAAFRFLRYKKAARKKMTGYR